MEDLRQKLKVLQLDLQQNAFLQSIDSNILSIYPQKTFTALFYS